MKLCLKHNYQTRYQHLSAGEFFRLTRSGASISPNYVQYAHGGCTFFSKVCTRCKKRKNLSELERALLRGLAANLKGPAPF